MAQWVPKQLTIFTLTFAESLYLVALKTNEVLTDFNVGKRLCFKRGVLLGFVFSKNHYSERASTLDFKGAAATGFARSDIVFNLFMKTQFLHFIALLSIFSKRFYFFRSMDQNNLISCQKYHKFLLLSIFAVD